MGKLLSTPDIEVSRNPANNSVSKLRGTFALPKSNSDSGQADSVLSFLKANADDLNLKQSDLSLVQSTNLPESKVFRYQQAINNVPVYDSYVLVQADESAVKQIDLSTVNATVSSNNADEKITPANAKKMANANVGNVELRDFKTEPKLIYFKTKDGLRLAYEVMVLTKNPPHDWQIFVDAQTGEVLQKTDLIMSLPDGSGMVFEPNPVVTAHNNGLRQPTATVATCGYAGSPLATIDAQRVTRVLKDLTFSGGKYKLDGPYAKIVNLDAPTSAIPEEATATAFNYSSSDERFGAVNLYYNIDTIQRYIQSLGITNANNRKTNADPTTSGWSAFYSPTDKSLHIGMQRPCRPDKSQEGDAIVHEYGHAIQDNQVPGWGTTNPITHNAETRAMGEGFGDILACVFFASFGGGFQREVFEDWAYSVEGSSGLRRVDGTRQYPPGTTWSGDEHTNGEIWSAALWNIYRAIGGDSITLADRNAARDAVLKTVINSHHRLLPSASMPDGAEAILREHAEDPTYRGKYLMQMLNSFHDRGILKCSTSANLYIRDQAGDAGAEATAGNFWNSPDLWITNTDIAGSTAASHVNPERGQDNWFHAKVTNKGTVTARAFVVTFNVKTWAGTQFVYPNDFTSFISAGVGFNLAPGASTVVKAKWPAGFVPPTGTHSCWLSSVYMPTDTTPSGKHVWESNNLAQKNMTIVNLIPGDSFVMPFQFANSLIRETQKLRIEVIRPAAFTKVPVSIMHTNAVEISKLFTSFQDGQLHDGQLNGATNNKPLAPILTFKENAKVEMGGLHSDEPVTIHAVSGTTIQLSGTQLTTIAAGTKFLTKQAILKGSEILFGEGISAGFPVLLQPGQMQTFNLKVAAPAGAKAGDTFDIDLVQRDEQNTITGGITVSVRIKQ